MQPTAHVFPQLFSPLPVGWLQNPKLAAENAGILDGSQAGRDRFELVKAVAQRDVDANQRLLDGWREELASNRPPHERIHQALGCSLLYESGLAYLAKVTQIARARGHHLSCKAILHDTWILVERYLHRCRADLGGVIPWFMRALRNQAYRAHRRAAGQREVDTIAAKLNKGKVAPAADIPVLNQETARQVAELARGISPRLAPVGEMVLEVRDVSTEQLAKELNVSANVISKMKREFLHLLRSDPRMKSVLTHPLPLIAPAPFLSREGIGSAIQRYKHQFNSLRERDRQALELYESGSSYADSAREIGIRVENYKMRVFRARRNFARAIKNDGHLLEESIVRPPGDRRAPQSGPRPLCG